MIVSIEQLRRRLSINDITIGDVEVDVQLGYIEIFGRAVNHQPARFSVFKPVSIEDVINAATKFFYGQSQVEAPIVDDGRKLGA